MTFGNTNLMEGDGPRVVVVGLFDTADSKSLPASGRLMFPLAGLCGKPLTRCLASCRLTGGLLCMSHGY